MVRVVQGRPGQLREELPGQQGGVLGEEAEDEAVQEPGDAEALALGDVDFSAGESVRQFGAFAPVQGAGDLGELLRKLLGKLGCGAMRFEEFRILEGGAEIPQVLRAVDVVVGEVAGFLALVARPFLLELRPCHDGPMIGQQ